MRLKVIGLTGEDREVMDGLIAGAVSAREAVKQEIERHVVGAGVVLADVKWKQLAEGGAFIVVQNYEANEKRAKAR